MENKENKVSRHFRIDVDLDRELDEFITASRRTKTAVVEDALREYLHKDGKSEADMVVEKVITAMDEKYGNLFTRLRLGTRTAEQNSTVLLDLANTMLLLKDVDEYAFMPVSERESLLISKSKERIKKMIETNKQKKDNAAIGEER